MRRRNRGKLSALTLAHQGPQHKLLACSQTLRIDKLAKVIM